MPEEEAFLILNSIPGLGAAKLRALVQKFGSAAEALNATEEQLHNLSGFERILPYWKNRMTQARWREDLELVIRYRATLLPFTHPGFPKALLKCPDAPALLYIRGSLKLQDDRSIAVVGTRHSSIYGNEMAQSISKELSSSGFTVVSGLARGVDTAAHRGALEAGRTLAVIGSGLANIYPGENRELAEEIVKNGALISEFPMQSPPDRHNFPQRNRIICGMALATLLIEAPLKSGAMITMQKAHAYERKLFALPGRVDSETFKGNHHLIKQGKAELIEHAADILMHFDDLFLHQRLKSLDVDLPLFDNEEKSIYEQMPAEESSLEFLTSRIPLPVHHLHRILMGLVLKRAVKEFPGKIYKKIAAGKVGK